MPISITLPKKEYHYLGNDQVGTQEIIKQYSVTAIEELEVIQILKAAGSAKDQKVMLGVKVGLATIALRRIDPEQTQDDTRKLPLPIIDAAFEFLMQERKGWKEGPTDPNAPSTGENTSANSSTSSKPSTGDSAPAGPSDLPAKASPKSTSKKSEPQQKPTLP
jgi:hypothetical protein